MAFLKDFVAGDEGLECLDFVGEDGLPAREVSIVVRVLLDSKKRRGHVVLSPQHLASIHDMRRAGQCSGRSKRSSPTLSCPARTNLSSCGPTYTQCTRAHACLRRYKLHSRRVGGDQRTFGRRLVDARRLADIDGELRLLPAIGVSAVEK